MLEVSWISTGMIDLKAVLEQGVLINADDSLIFCVFCGSVETKLIDCKICEVYEL
jgi:hypothetical protein